MRNESKHTFIDISSELYREYTFPGRGRVSITVRIDNPTDLSVSESGGHRLLDAEGVSHYIPAGWVELRWKARDGAPNFVA
ncbi:hypothetical protein G3A43_07665 [Paraburkholderia aspalathi]|nr:hypothetical protein [Paraburkholderia aspalathi]MBK3780132.1 hypothetical protein [Paraburkholderia aspalathi]